MAGSFLVSQSREVRPARAEQLPDGRKRLTRFVSFKQNSEFPAEMGGAVPTTTDAATNWASPPTGWSDLYLISANTDTSLSPNGSGNNPVTILTFETAGTISQTDETRNNGALLIRTIRTAHTAPGTPVGYTIIRIDNDNPSGFDTFTYTFAKGTGIVFQQDSTKNDDKLLLRTIRYLTVPGTLNTKGSNPTPAQSGYTLVDESYEEADGHRIWTTNYAAGSGEISNNVDWSQGATQGAETVGVTKTTIRYLTALDATMLPATLSGSVLIGADYTEADGYRIWTTTWAKGVGEVSRSDETRNNGKLLLATITHLTAPGESDPVATLSGYVRISVTTQKADGHWIWRATFAAGDGEISRSTDLGQNGTTEDGTLGVTRLAIEHLTSPAASEPTWGSVSGYIKLSVRSVERDGHMVWTGGFAKGVGEVTSRVRARQDGLREQTIISLGTRVAPDGIVIEDSSQTSDGFIIYTVTAMQEGDGGATPTSATVEFERYVPFTYPGRAKTYSATVNGRTFIDVFRSPPVTTDVKATITVSYTTTNTLGTISDYWNPKEWATLRAAWVGYNDEPFNQVSALTGYRSVSTTPVEATASSSPPSDLSCMGNPVFGGAKANVVCTGGPADPGGDTFTLDATIEPAFTSTAGVVYYRKTIVTATIPAQAALPV
jgi:hypothetical protein